jgi:cytochrome c oxidase subunit 2
MNNPSMFSTHSPQTRDIAGLFYFDLAISAVIFLVVTALVVYVIWRFRAKPGDGEPVQDPGNTRLETLWTVIPGIILIGLLIYTARVMHSVNPPPGDRAPDVIVIAHQWWWEYRYPESGVVTANELHMPAGSNWLIQIESADVIHDFWVPNLGAKVDATPGVTSYIWIHPDKPGVFWGTCAEYCGAEHAMMGIRVIVDTPEDYLAWQQSQLQPRPEPATEAAQRGAALYASKTCVNCHEPPTGATAGKRLVGPDLRHLATRQTLASAMFPNDFSTLTRWLLDPEKMKPASNMPNLHLTEQEARDLSAYLGKPGL